MFFSFDGIDGGGKSTQLGLFADWLSEQGYKVATCRDPGSTAAGEAIRRLLLDPASALDRRAEMLLYMAARAQLVDELILPALAAGKIVVADRYLLANVVYQGHAGGLDPAVIWEIGQVATAGILPALTFVLDVPPEVAAQRLNRPLDRMESQGDEFRQRLRQGYLAEAARRPQEIIVIDASRPIGAVQADIRQAAERLLRQP